VGEPARLPLGGEPVRLGERRPLARGPDQSVDLGRARGGTWCLFRGPTPSFLLLFFYFFEFVLLSIHILDAKLKSISSKLYSSI
jgi:hypothetical protein